MDTGKLLYVCIYSLLTYIIHFIDYTQILLECRCYIIVVYGPTSTSTAEFQTTIMSTFSTSVQEFILDEGERPAMLFRLEKIVLPNHIPSTYTVQGSDVLPDMNYYAFVIFKYENDGVSSSSSLLYEPEFISPFFSISIIGINSPLSDKSVDYCQDSPQ